MAKIPIRCEIFKKQQKTHPCVICNYYILCKFTWKSFIFIGLQECDILAYERVTDKQTGTRSEG
jgi:hypothetical protein